MDAMARSRTLAAVALAAALLGAALSGATAPPASAAISGCLVSDATLNWGFKESFRAYIDGDIANGEWTTADGATYDTPLFSWTGGSGVYDPKDGTGLVSFTGSVRFTGHGGLLDTTIANPQIRFDGGSGVLLLDVSGPTMEGDPIDLTEVEFIAMPTVEVVGDDAVRSVDAGTELAADGAVAFPNYPAGDSFDRVELTLPVGKQCPTEGGAGVIDDTAVDYSPTIIFSAVGAAIIAATVGGIVVATRRRRGA